MWNKNSPSWQNSTFFQCGQKNWKPSHNHKQREILYNKQYKLTTTLDYQNYFDTSFWL
jgi:hypothetical protein